MKQLFFALILLLWCFPSRAQNSALTFCAFNLKNFSIQEVQGSAHTKPKSKREIEAILNIFVETKADLLGLIEMGSNEDLLYLQNALKIRGVNLPYTSRVSGIDHSRSLAVLSKYPLKSHSPKTIPLYEIDDKVFGMSRNILDLEVQISNSCTIRIVGCHLKSQREVPEGPQEWMRRNEAHLVRLHLLSILQQDPSTPILLFGDFNEYRNHPSIQEIEGKRGHTTYFKPLEALDSKGHSWTHYWKAADVYSRFDYLFVNQNMQKLMLHPKVSIIDTPEVAIASDHRPLLLQFTLRLPKS